MVVHLIGDLLQSIGVIIAALIIYFNEDYKIVDPICTYLFSVLVMFTTIPVFRECCNILMEKVPNSIRADHLKEDIQKIRGVNSVDDLHVWAVAGGKNFLTAHIRLQQAGLEEIDNYKEILRVHKEV